MHVAVASGVVITRDDVAAGIVDESVATLEFRVKRHVVEMLKCWSE